MNSDFQDYFMSIAEQAATQSKGNRKGGACIVDSRTNNILGIGYNTFPSRCKKLWEDTNDDMLILHAERNAIYNNNIYNTNSENIKGAIMFVTSEPCNECAITILKCGISTIYYMKSTEELNEDEDNRVKAAKRMFKTADIIYEVYERQLKPRSDAPEN